MIMKILKQWKQRNREFQKLRIINQHCKKICRKINWDTRNENLIFAEINIRDLGWYLVVFGRVHNYDLLLCIFIETVSCGLLDIFSVKNYTVWFNELWKYYSPLLIDTTSKDIIFCNQGGGIIPIPGKFDTNTTHFNYNCYQFCIFIWLFIWYH